ncbi:hypothetical protein GGH12_001047 [Coemansia sp. RSA 1822]|nr:hypothetical protein GGH12_001047 [Coemansia sp. RSA 1822]
MLHITIDGKPVVLDDLGQVSNGGNVNVMVMNPDNQKTGSGQNVGAKGAPNDDDILDDDGPDAEPTTHSLDVDSDDSDSDDDSDSEIEIETETDSDDDYKILQLNISALVVALAAYTQAKTIGSVHKRGLYAGEQPLVYAEDVSARASEAVATDTAAVQSAQVAQAPTVGQQAPLAQGALPQGPAGVQRVADAAQLLLPAQPTAAGLSNAVQAVSVLPAAQPLAAPVAASAPISAASIPVAAAPAIASVPAGVMPAAASIPAATAASIPAAPIPAAVQAAPAVAPAAQVPAAAPFAALNYSELAYAQPAAAPAAPAAAVVDPGTAAVYAQQQYYPAVAAQPVIQQVLPPTIQKDAVALQGGVYGNTMPTAMLINNPVVPQAVIPIDASLSELIAQAGAATSTSASASAEATSPLDDNGEEPASASESADSDDADIAALRRKIKAKAHKAAHSAKSADADDAETESAEDIESTADADAASASPKARASGKKKSSKKTKAKDVAQDEIDETESGFDYKASTDDQLEESSSAELDTQLGYKRIGSPHQRSAQGGLRDEAAKARAEAAEDARAAVLSEIRADASAEAAQHASAELHLDGKSVRDEEASASHLKDDYETAKEYSHESDTAESEEYVHTRALEDEGSNTSTVERYASPENTSRYGHASWANEHSTYGDAYYPNESSSASEDSYSHGASSYGDNYKASSYEDKDSSYEDNKDSSHGDKVSPFSEYKVHYSDASATVDTASEGSTTYSDNTYSHTYSDNTYSPYYEHSGNHDESQKPLNFVNAHADASFARDAAGVAPSVSAIIRDAASAMSDGPHAVNELDPLSYGTQGYAGRNNMPLSGADNFSQESVVVIGFPQATGSATSVAPAASTVMVTKVITPAVKVIYASNSS